MSTLTTVLAILVALEHLYIMFLETIATSSESTSRVFGISNDQLKSKTISSSDCCLATEFAVDAAATGLCRVGGTIW